MQLTRTELKNLQALLTKKGRRQYGRFLAEGVRLMEESLRFSLRPDTVYFAPSELSERARKLIERFRHAGVSCREIPVRQLGQLADTKSPQGIVGVFTAPSVDLTQLYTRRHRTILVCDNVSDPGNLGTLVRSALAFGFRLVIAVGSTAEPFAPKVVRSSVGAAFGVKMAVAEYAELERLVKAEQITLLAATGTGEKSLTDCIRRDADSRYALVVGSEAEGLSGRILGLAACAVRIAHSPEVDSLNAAVAGSILMKGMYDLLH